jgi:hypothetical protein
MKGKKQGLFEKSLRLTGEPGYGIGVVESFGKQELKRHLLIEPDVMSGDDDAHAARSKHAVDAILSVEDVALAYSSRRVGTALRHALAPSIPGAKQRQRKPSPVPGHSRRVGGFRQGRGRFGKGLHLPHRRIAPTMQSKPADEEETRICVDESRRSPGPARRG